MAISKSQKIVVDLVGDGVATSVNVDLERDPYFLLGTSTNSGLTADQLKAINQVPVFKANPPTSAVNVGNVTPSNLSFTVSLAYPILTITFGAALSTTPQSVEVMLLW
jgi:hypothetical protein